MVYESICWRCNGFGRIQSLEHPWWMFWKEMACPVCDGTGTIKKEITEEDCIKHLLDKVENLERKIRKY
jgi:DnaJ-class molecular chaperone